MSTYHFFKGQMELENNKLDEALKSFNRAIEYNSTNADFYYFKALTLSKLNELKASLDEFDQALSLDPSKSDYYYNKAKCLYRMNIFKCALGAIQKALEINSLNKEYLVLKNLCLAALGIQSIETKNEMECVKNDPGQNLKKVEYMNSLRNKANDFCQKKNFIEALREIEKLIEIDPMNYEYYSYKGLILQEIGENEEALKYSILAIKYNKESNDDMLFARVWELVDMLKSTQDSTEQKATEQVNHIDINDIKQQEVYRYHECKECAIKESEKRGKVKILYEIEKDVAECKISFI